MAHEQDVELRQVGESEIELFLELLAREQRERNPRHEMSAQSEALWRQRLLEKTHTTAFLAFSADEAAGFATCVGPEHGTRAAIVSLYVRPELRRQGLGTRIYRCIELQLGKQGAQELMVSTQAGDAVGLAFLEGLGFEIQSHRLTKQLSSDS